MMQLSFLALKHCSVFQSASWSFLPTAFAVPASPFLSDLAAQQLDPKSAAAGGGADGSSGGIDAPVDDGPGR